MSDSVGIGGESVREMNGMERGEWMVRGVFSLIFN